MSPQTKSILLPKVFPLSLVNLGQLLPNPLSSSINSCISKRLITDDYLKLEKSEYTATLTLEKSGKLKVSFTKLFRVFFGWSRAERKSEGGVGRGRRGGRKGTRWKGEGGGWDGEKVEGKRAQGKYWGQGGRELRVEGDEYEEVEGREGGGGVEGRRGMEALGEQVERGGRREGQGPGRAGGLRVEGWGGTGMEWVRSEPGKVL